MEDIIITDREKLAKIKKAMADGGADNLHILADFDRTLTRAYNGKVYVSSLVAVLREGGYLKSDYAAKAQALFDHYHRIEIDDSVPLPEKRQAMKEWWTAHFELLIDSGLKFGDLERIADSGLVKLRFGCEEFLANLQNKKIPLVIMSSSGVGREGISIFLKRSGSLFNNIGIISNEFEWAPDGKALGVRQPIIYGMNKDATLVLDFPDVFKKVKNRKNVILLGDNVSDAEMIKGFAYENLLKIGFLNERIEENLDCYKASYDIIILNDGSMECVNDLLKEII
jgi:5'-nucleotidase